MNIRGNPLEAYDSHNNYKRDAIWDYEKKKDNEKQRWKKIYERDAEKLHAARRKFLANNPGYTSAKAAEMRKKGGDDARLEIARRKKELGDLVRECNCEFPLVLPWDQQEKAFVYFKKLKEARARIKAEREKSL